MIDIKSVHVWKNKANVFESLSLFLIIPELCPAHMRNYLKYEKLMDTINNYLFKLKKGIKEHILCVLVSSYLE